MIDRGKKNVLGVNVNIIDYEGAVERIAQAARDGQSLGVSALAVHGVMTGALDPEHRHRLNQLDLIVPDGQPVRWALNTLHFARLDNRVYGPELMLRVCARAEQDGLPIFLYGSTEPMLAALRERLLEKFPALIIAGSESSRFRTLTPEERDGVAERIRASGAKITFVGLGCPRQEIWVYEMKPHLQMPLLAVGAAFSFHAGHLEQAPPTMQKYGLEWLFRLVKEPTRLWRRYLMLNPLYLTLFFLQMTQFYTLEPDVTRPPAQEVRPG
jgi:exopolysaccharide biosynthesis WecB/TagA/CpsF family protein